MFMRGLIRFFLFIVVCTVFFLMAGGRAGLLVMPFDFFMVVGINALIVFTSRAKVIPTDYSLSNLRKIQDAGYYAMIASTIFPMLLGFIYTSNYLTGGVELIAHLINQRLTGIMYAILIYVCFFAGMEGMAKDSSMPAVTKLKSIGVPVMISVGAVAVVMICSSIVIGWLCH